MNIINFFKKRIYMKKTFLTLLFVTLCCNVVKADFRPIVIQNGGAVNDHIEHYIPFDQPDVYYDDVAQAIIIDGDEVSYYDVEIASTSNWTVYVSTQVLGTYDTIDVSSLPQGEYCITIYSP